MSGAVEQQLRLRGWRPSPWVAAKLLVLLAIGGLGEYIFAEWLFGTWTPFINHLIWFAIAAGFAVTFRGWSRDVTAWVAALMLCFAGAEAYAHYRLMARFVWATEPPLTAKDPVLGWALAPAGRYHHLKVDPQTEQKVFDVHYTIGTDRSRQVVSDARGPTVVFLGDSLTFGEGLPDVETLPQLFADKTGRRLRVLNLGVVGYGPQQFLRALETGVYDDLLGKPRALVYETGPWHADLTACVADWVMPAPRYRLVGGLPVFSGDCSDRWSWLIGRLFTIRMYSAYLAPVLSHPTPSKIDLYVTVMSRSAALAREKFGAPTVLLYLPDPNYVADSGITDEQIIAELRAAGLIVIDGRLDSSDFPGEPLVMPGEGHPTGVANRARAELLTRALADLGLLPN